MKLTNRFSLPDALVKAASGYASHTPQPGRISVTELIGPPQIRTLTHQHWDDIEEDVADRIYSIMGTAVHEVMRHSAHANTLSEERLAIDVDGWTVHGTPDLYEDDGTVTDWKNVSVWSIIYGGDREDWLRQLNCYRYLLETHGFPVKQARIIAFLRDWSKRKAQQEPDYPQQQVLTIPVTLWPLEQAKDYIWSRVGLHRLSTEGTIIPDCTPEERWEKPTTYAVMKNANVRASRVLDSEAEAQAWMAAQAADFKAKWRIEKRPGESTRCSAYCRVSQFCNQWKAIQAAQEQAHG